MLQNNADARRCSYFELGLLVDKHVHVLSIFVKEIIQLYCFDAGGVRHDPQRFMGKTVTEPHFNRDTVEFASRKRVACSRLRDSGERSSSKKKCEKRAGAGESFARFNMSAL